MQAEARALAAQGAVAKEMEYDSFGNILKETAPEFRMPLLAALFIPKARMLANG